MAELVAGKSSLIRVISQWAEASLRTDDDRNPDQPIVILAAPTGTAASNIKGLTLHTAFSLPFGNTFTSLPDKNKHKLSYSCDIKLFFTGQGLFRMLAG